jgi:hypothetical protein
MQCRADVLTVRDLFRPRPDQWVNAVVEIDLLVPPTEDEMGELTDMTKPGTVGLWHDDTHVTFTHPIDDAVAAFGSLQLIVERADGWLERAGLHGIPISARLQLATYE